MWRACPHEASGKLIEVGLANDECTGGLEQPNSPCVTVWRIGVGGARSRRRKAGNIDVVLDGLRYAIKGQATVALGRKRACLADDHGFFTQADEDCGIIDLANAAKRSLDRLHECGCVGPMRGQQRSNSMGHKQSPAKTAGATGSMQGAGHCRQPRCLRISWQARLTVLIDSRDRKSVV